MNAITPPEVHHHVQGRTSTASIGFWAVCITQFMTAFVDNAFRIGIVVLAVFIEVQAIKSGNTDGQLIIAFRESDVIAAGDLVDMTSYPFIDTKAGGSIDGLLVALNQLIAMAAPDRQSEGGTVIVPGHGRMIDQSEVALYRNMVTIIRNLVQYYKNEGKTLNEVLALKPSDGYDARWGKTTGPWTTRDFITAIYQTLPAKGPVYFTMKNATLVPGGKAF